MKKFSYVALFRGLNVGGKRIVKMVDLKAFFEEMGFADVATYIQSGNVMFNSTVKSNRALEKNIEKAFEERFKFTSLIVVLSKKELEKVVSSAPEGFSKNLKKHRCDVIFLKKPLTVKEALEKIETREGVDEVHDGPGVIYFSRLTKKASQSKLSKIVQMPIYKKMTIRNWNTTRNILEKMNEKR